MSRRSDESGQKGSLTSSLPSAINADQPLGACVRALYVTGVSETDMIGETCCVVRGAFLWFKVIYIMELPPFFLTAINI